MDAGVTAIPRAACNERSQESGAHGEVAEACAALGDTLLQTRKSTKRGDTMSARGAFLRTCGVRESSPPIFVMSPIVSTSALEKLRHGES